MKRLTDYQGQSLRLTPERLTHILQHPEMVLMEDKIEETLHLPEQVRRSNTDPTVLLNYRYYENTLVGNKWLCVAIKYINGDAFLLTAYLTHRIKKGELLWQQP